MTYKNFMKSILIFLTLIIFSTLIITIFYHNNLINLKTVKILELLNLLISSLISGLYIGIKSKNKAYINGLILGSIITFPLILLSILINRKITIISLIIYILVLLIIIISSIIGINKRR
jgi:putative membrane protein (TIGR04086 family)